MLSLIKKYNFIMSAVLLSAAILVIGCKPGKSRLFSGSLSVGTTRAALEPALSPVATSSSSPNILFILTDDHTIKSISKYSNFFPFHSTPNLDALADDGMLFKKAFVANSICAPSRAAILSGAYGHISGVPVNKKKFQNLHYGLVKTFPEVFQDNGLRRRL